MITQKQLQKLVDKWDVNYKPSFRRPTCANCGRTLWFRMWHVFLKEFGNKREIHLCGKCGKKYGIS
jgi:RNase P subunit RPR2